MFRSILALTSLVLASCALPTRPLAQGPEATPTGALLLYLQKGSPVLVVKDELSRCAASSEDFDQVKSLAVADRERLVRTLVTGERSTRDALRACRPHQCTALRAEEIASLMADVDSGENFVNSWKPLRALYGQRTVVTIGTFAVEGDRALSCYRARSGPMAGWFSVVFLRLEKGTWRVIEEVQTLIE